MDGLFHTILDGITYDLAKRLVWEVVMLGAANIFVAAVFKRLKQRREIFIYWVSGLVILTGLFQIIGSRPQEPDFKAGIAGLQVGGASGHSSIAVITMTIINAGTMQSIVKNWHIEATVAGTVYKPTFSSPMPEVVSFDTSGRGPSVPNLVNYHVKQDDIVEKTIIPLQPGALVSGTLYVIFPNLDSSVFSQGGEFTVTFEDVFSKKYAATNKIVPKIEPGSIKVIPGLHTEAICPVPDHPILPLIPPGGAPADPPRLFKTPPPIPTPRKRG